MIGAQEKQSIQALIDSHTGTLKYWQRQLAESKSEARSNYISGRIAEIEKQRSKYLSQLEKNERPELQL